MVSTLREASGRVLMVGLADTDIDAATGSRLRRLRPGGVILFTRNLESARQTVALIGELRRLAPHPLLVALDQEGGRVSRLEGWVGPTPTATCLASAGEAAVARFARATGRVLRALGFNLDFAPVVDLCAPEVRNGIGDRSYGTDPDLVTRLAGAFLDGVQAAGVAGCLKHFPGLGTTLVDSHQALPRADRTRAELLGEDLVPYRELGSRAAAVMVGHAHYPALDPDAVRPATLSRSAVDGLLRSELGYAGLVVSDDLEMGAVCALDVDGAAAVEAVAAGCELVLYCRDLDRAENAAAALEAQAAADPRFQARLRAAERAVHDAASRWPAGPGSLPAWEQARRELMSSCGPFSAEVRP
jgi:beta-N-acetylhexosaminidase